VPAARIHLLGNGVDLARFDPAGVDGATRATVRDEMGAGDGDVVCGVVGRLVWEKGYREVLEAAAALRERAPNVRVVIVGPEDPDKADGVRPSDLRGVTWLGHRDDMAAVYGAMDVYVLASYREGFPRSAMEAAAMGLPVIATDIRGCRQVVDDGVTGRLVPPRDAAALTEAVATVAGDAALRERMGAAARVKATREFDQQRVIDLTLGVYADLLATHGRR
jgi:glycosyltransferase involved in cell wall biosynthesis